MERVTQQLPNAAREIFLVHLDTNTPCSAPQPPQCAGSLWIETAAINDTKLSSKFLVGVSFKFQGQHLASSTPTYQPWLMCTENPAQGVSIKMLNAH